MRRTRHFVKRKKFHFAESEVRYAGFMLDSEGYHLYSELTDAIAKFLPPKNLTYLRSFMGLVNQLNAFTSYVEGQVEPLRALLSSKNEFV